MSDSGKGSCCPGGSRTHGSFDESPGIKIDEQNDKMDFAIIGDASTGKTSLILRKVKNEFLEDTQPTVIDGVDIIYQDAQRKKTTFHLSDTGGQVDYRSVPVHYIKSSKGIILVCSYDRPESVENLKHWKELIENNSNLKEKSLYVILNKSDLKKPESQLYDDVEKWAHDSNALFFETSAKSDPQSVNDAFDNIFESFLNPMKEDEEKKENDEKKE